MNTLIVISSIVAIVIVVVSVFLIRTLIQVRRTAIEAEKLLAQLNEDVSLIGKIAGSVANFAQNFSSPWVKAGSIFSGIISNFISRGKKQ